MSIELSTLMSWVVVVMTVFFPLSLVMDLVERDPKQLESPLSKCKNRGHHA
jgi:hypothetical protein